jgi:hypothetical protein
MSICYYCVHCRYENIRNWDRLKYNDIPTEDDCRNCDKENGIGVEVVTTRIFTPYKPFQRL